MAENVNALILPIGADPSQFKKSIEEVKDAIKKLSTSIASTSFNFVSPEQKKDLADLKRTLNELQSDVVNTGNALSKGEESTKKASRALTSLSLVAQDAPFGFIGIQNNLPGVIQAFGQLDFKTNGLKGGLKELGSSLVGPGGLFLAFSVVTAAVTFAIKEYGSLTNAVKVLFGANSVAIKSQNEFNKALANAADNTGAQIAKINILVKTIQDENTSQQDRLAAYRELKKVNPDVVAGIDEQNLSTSKSIKLIGENAKAQLEFIKLQTKSAAISKALDGLEQRRFETNGKYNEAREAEKKLISDLQIAEEKRSRGEKLTQLQTNNLARKNILLDDAAKAVQKERDEISRITADTDKWYKSLEPVIGAISKISSNADDLTNKLEEQRKAEEEAAKAAKKRKDITLSVDTQDLDAAFNLDKIISSITKYGNALLDTNKSVEERKNALKELVAINPQVFSGLSIEKSATLANKDAIESYIRSLQILIKQREFDARARQLNAEFLKQEIKNQEALEKAEQDRVDGLWKIIEAEDKLFSASLLKKSFQFFENLKKQQDIIDAINKGLNNIYGPGTAEENDPVKRVEELSKRIKQAKDNFENTIRRGLQQPFEDFFSTLIETGKFSLDSFEGLFKDMLKRIAAQIVSAGIAKLISSILFPPSAAAGALAGAAAGKQSGGIIDALISLFGGRRAFNNVNFGGLEGGGMQMSGQVVFVQRGSDLVGVLNRTNGTINRVG